MKVLPKRQSNHERRIGFLNGYKPDKLGYQVDTNVTDYLLSSTRAVRRRLDLDKPVDRDAILQCLSLAIQAPTASNSQTWRWLVIDDPDLRAQIACIFRENATPRIKRLQQRARNNAQTNRVLDSALHLTQVLGKVPVLVVPCVQGRLDDPAAMSPAAFYGSIFPAVWSFQLALRSRGMGSVLTTPFSGSGETAYTSILNIPPTFTPVALLPVAYTLGDHFTPAKRPPVETVTRWNRWQD